MLRNVLKAFFICLPLLGMAAVIPAHAQEKVNINTADRAALVSGIRGVGPAKADSIIMEREKNGAFQTVDELTRVRGIGPSLVDANRDNLSVE